MEDSDCPSPAPKIIMSSHQNSDTSDGSSCNHLVVSGLYEDEGRERKSSISFDKIKQISLTYSLQSENEDRQPTTGDENVESNSPKTDQPCSPIDLCNLVNLKQAPVQDEALETECSCWESESLRHDERSSLAGGLKYAGQTDRHKLGKRGEFARSFTLVYDNCPSEHSQDELDQDAGDDDAISLVLEADIGQDRSYVSNLYGRSTGGCRVRDENDNLAAVQQRSPTITGRIRQMQSDSKLRCNIRRHDPGSFLDGSSTGYHVESFDGTAPRYGNRTMYPSSNERNLFKTRQEQPWRNGLKPNLSKPRTSGLIATSNLYQSARYDDLVQSARLRSKPMSPTQLEHDYLGSAIPQEVVFGGQVQEDMARNLISYDSRISRKSPVPHWASSGSSRTELQYRTNHHRSTMGYRHPKRSLVSNRERGSFGPLIGYQQEATARSRPDKASYGVSQSTRATRPDLVDSLKGTEEPMNDSWMNEASTRKYVSANYFADERGEYQQSQVASRDFLPDSICRECSEQFCEPTELPDRQPANMRARTRSIDSQDETMTCRIYRSRNNEEQEATKATLVYATPVRVTRHQMSKSGNERAAADDHEDGQRTNIGTCSPNKSETVLQTRNASSKGRTLGRWNDHIDRLDHKRLLHVRRERSVDYRQQQHQPGSQPDQVGQRTRSDHNREVECFSPVSSAGSQSCFSETGENYIRGQLITAANLWRPNYALRDADHMDEAERVRSRHRRHQRTQTSRSIASRAHHHDGYRTSKANMSQPQMAISKFSATAGEPVCMSTKTEPKVTRESATRDGKKSAARVKAVSLTASANDQSSEKSVLTTQDHGCPDAQQNLKLKSPPINLALAREKQLDQPQPLADTQSLPKPQPPPPSQQPVAATSQQQQQQPQVQVQTNFKPVKLRNLVSDEQTLDNLHCKYKANNKSHGCNEHRCLGSLMNPKPVENQVRSGQEILEQATEFINNYYASIKRTDSPAHKQRLTEVEQQIKTTDTYYLKETELIYGAKQAWRNAARCVGRIQWSKLQVFDARFTSTASEMFEALCNHIKYATNKGSLRSAITILPQRVKSVKNDWRIWNSQLIGYAGYRNKETGEVVGDPANADMTEACQRLGWQGKGGRFDILPLVLQAAGGPPELFVIPEEIVLRVKIRHPKYKWFEELGLEWYALPAVANMSLDVGGLQFTAAPFSGWYMVTEIGTRDLGDAGRYNMLEPVALRMGLNTTSNMSLWKDQAIVELNIAVLDSFQSQGVTMVDHHTASETFMTHLANEQRLRGGCPADWVWLVPPTSGSSTQLFHQEMVNYHLLPNYEYLEPVHKSFDWQAYELNKLAALQTKSNGILPNGKSPLADSKLAFKVSPESQLSPARSKMVGVSPSSSSAQLAGDMTPRKLRFKEIARAVKFTSKLFGKALSRRIKATILYATETGKSERFANRLAQTFSHAFNVHLMSMSDYDMTCLEHEALLLIVTSTFGNGDPPEAGELFAKHLAAVKITGDTSPDIDSINSVSTNPFFQMLSEADASSLPVDSVDYVDKSNSDTIRPTSEQKSKQTSSPHLTPPVSDQQVQQMSIKPLSNVRFGVFALGSTAYPHFCAFGRYVDQTLAELGAERILKCTCGDELCGQEKAFNNWSNEVFRIACDVFCLTDSVGLIEECTETVWTPSSVRFVPVELLASTIPDTPVNPLADLSNGNSSSPPQTLFNQTPTKRQPQNYLASKRTIVRNLMGFTNKRILPFTVRNRTNLHKFVEEENLQTLRIDLEPVLLTGSSLFGGTPNQSTPNKVNFEPGDHVAIYPVNKLEMVDRIVSRMQSDLRKVQERKSPVIEKNSNSPTPTQSTSQIKIDFDQVYSILVKRENMDLTPAMTATHDKNEATWIPHDRLPITSIREALTRYLDITSPPNQEFLMILSRQTSDPDEKKRLQLLARNSTIYEEWKNKNVPQLINVLDQFQTINFEPALATQIPLMKPRFYSVSGTSVSLTLGVVRYRTAAGEMRQGLCSNYLNELKIEPKSYLFGYIRSAPAFHMPLDKSVPMILISAGTGLAPFRSFWQQRCQDMAAAAMQNNSNQAQPIKFGPIELYFGCRNSNYILYKDELDEMYEKEVLRSVNIAFSRPIDKDLILETTTLNSTQTSATKSNLSNGILPKTGLTNGITNGVEHKTSTVATIKQASKKMYVQDRLMLDGENICKLIMHRGAHVYVCGDVAMASGVYKTLVSVVASHHSNSTNKQDNCNPSLADGGSSGDLRSMQAITKEEAETIMMNLRNLNRYHEDIFGAKQAS